MRLVLPRKLKRIADGGASNMASKKSVSLRDSCATNGGWRGDGGRNGLLTIQCLIRADGLSQFEQLGVHAEARPASGVGIDFKEDAVSLDKEIDGCPAFGKSRRLANQKHRLSFRLGASSGLLVGRKRSTYKQDVARRAVFFRRRKPSYDDVPALDGLLRRDRVERSSKGVFAEDADNERG